MYLKTIPFYTLLPELLLFIGTAVGFTYGAIKFFKKGKALFLKIIACASGCVALGQLFTLAQTLTNGRAPDGFHVGLLGTVGCYFLLFSGSFGQIDGLGDSRDKSLRKYRIISFLPPILIVCAYLLIAFGNTTLDHKIIYGMLFLLFAQTSYYNLKHILLPDVENGILKSIRSYNCALLLLTFVNIIIVFSNLKGWFAVKLICYVISAGIYASIGWIANKGVQKWYL